MKSGDIYSVSLDPTGGHGQKGSRPVLIVSPDEFNQVTKLPVVLPVATGGDFARRLGFSVTLTGIKTTGGINLHLTPIIIRDIKWYKFLGNSTR